MNNFEEEKFATKSVVINQFEVQRLIHSSPFSLARKSASLGLSVASVDQGFWEYQDVRQTPLCLDSR